MRRIISADKSGRISLTALILALGAQFCLFLPICGAGAWAADKAIPAASAPAPAAVNDKFAPLRDFTADNRKLGFGEKKKSSAEAVKGGEEADQAATSPTAKKIKAAGGVDKSAWASDDKGETAKKVKSVSSGSMVSALVVTVLGLGVVLWVAIVAVKKFLPGGKALFSTPAMEILGRTQFDSQKYLALVRLGKRILVVGVSSGGFDAVTEITDETEAADIMALAKPKTPAGKELFHRMFQKQMAGVELSSGALSDLNASTGAAAEAGNQADIAGIQARVRSLREAE